MRRGGWTLLVGGLVLSAAGSEAAQPASKAPVYPAARRAEQVDEYHGVKVADPYRWLEELDGPETRTWIENQNRLTEAWLAQVPGRAAIHARLTKLNDFERYGVPELAGSRYLYTRNDGLQNQAALYVADTPEATPRVLLDPNTLSADGTMALTGKAASDDGRYLAYGLAEAGSDWNVWRVREIATGKDLTDELRWIKFAAVSWTPDNAGFFYSRFAEPKPGAELDAVNRFQKVYYHRLGTPQSADALIYERPDQPAWYLFAQATEDGRYLVIHAVDTQSVNNALFFKDLSHPDGKVMPLVDRLDAQYEFVGNDSATFFLKTNLDAPRQRLVAVDSRHPERFQELVGQVAETLDQATLVGDRFLLRYLKDARALVKVHALDGTARGEVTLPGLGTVEGFIGRRRDREVFYTFTSFTTPGTIYRYEVEAGRSSLFRAPKLAFDPGSFETRQVFYASKDGTRVPMFLVHRKGLVLDGKNPTLLYGYGGFAVSMTPAFAPSKLEFVERGGVYALANLRGGGEYGEAWHEAGRKLKKQNVFDDFIAAAEWLVAQRYTQPRLLAIQGGSNGGLLVGACMNQRPELFGAALPAVGVMDMLRFHKFTVGWGWVRDYGSPDDASEFQALRAYSPLHNLKAGSCYPPTLITTGDHDDRVFPAHSFKYAAALQQAQGCPNPALIRIETRAGHGAGKPLSKAIDEAADLMAFLKAVLVP